MSGDKKPLSISLVNNSKDVRNVTLTSIFTTEEEDPQPLPKSSVSNTPKPQPLRADRPPNENVPWLLPGLVIQCHNQTLAGGRYHKTIGVVDRIVDTFGAHIRIASGPQIGDTILLDQEDCRTVQPNIGQPVMIIADDEEEAEGTGVVQRSYKRMRGILVEADVERREGVVELDPDGHCVRFKFWQFTKVMPMKI